MGTPTFKALEGKVTPEQIQDWIVKLVRDLNFELTNIDTQNVNRLDAKVIIANTITANKLNVAQLSAITADMGILTAGIIYGAYIATANGTYPRIELNSVGNLLTAFLDATHKMEIIPNLGGVPSLKFTAPGQTGNVALGAAFSFLSNSEIDIQNTSGSVFIATPGKLDITAPSGVYINGIRGLAGTNIFYVSDTSGGAVTRKLTFTDGILTSKT